MVLVLLVVGVAFVWIAVEVGLFGLDEAAVAAVPLGGMAVILGALLLVWLWLRRARWK